MKKMVFGFIKRISLFILLGVLFCVIFNMGSGSSAVMGSGLKPDPITLGEPPRAMWVWDAKIFQYEDASGRLLKFCNKWNIGTIFYTAYKVTGINTENDYRRFNAQAHKRGILVHALAGDPRWGLEKYHHRFLGWANDVLEFNRKARPQERFDGLHADVEPYLLGKMWEQSKSKMLIEYLEACSKVRELIKEQQTGIIFAVDLPFWYDDDTDMWVEWRNKMSPANYHALDIVDEIAIMDYRNFAQGENGSILLAKNEIDYASGIGKKAYIGQETIKELQPEYIKFGVKDADYMEREIKKLVNVYIDKPGFKGIAMHHYISYKKLLKKSGKAVE